MKNSISLLTAFLLLLLPVIPAQAYLPSDPLYYQQGYLNYVNISSAWDLDCMSGNFIPLEVAAAQLYTQVTTAQQDLTLFVSYDREPVKATSNGIHI